MTAEPEQYAIEVELVEEHESKCDLDVLATCMDAPIMATKETSDEEENIMSAFVGSAVTLGRAEEWLFDNGSAKDGATSDTQTKTNFAPMEIYSKSVKSLGLIQCKSDPCLFVLFDKYGIIQVIVVVICDDCIIAGREKWVTRLKIGISGKMAMSDLGELKRYLGVDFRFSYDEHIRSGAQMSDAMTKNISLVVFAKHATLMSEGMFEYLYHDPQNTEAVKIYC
jgi:hypothetical protein